MEAEPAGKVRQKVAMQGLAELQTMYEEVAKTATCAVPQLARLKLWHEPATEAGEEKILVEETVVRPSPKKILETGKAGSPTSRRSRSASRLRPLD